MTGVVRQISDYRRHKQSVKAPEATGKGFALLHRKIMDTPFYKDPEASHLWVHLLLKANFEPTYVSTDFGDVLCERGEFITGRNTLSLEAGIKSSDRIKYLLNKFEKLEMITRESNTRFTKITIIKYDEYQQFSVPTECQQNAIANPVAPTLSEEVVPADCQQSATVKELNTNSLAKANESTSANHEKTVLQEKKKPAISCEDVVNSYHEILPNAPRIKALSERRRNLIRTFWRKAAAINRQMGGKSFTLEDWRNYLTYTATNCHWMFEERLNNQRGTVWHKKNIDFFLSDNTYLKVREGEHDDR